MNSDLIGQVAQYGMPALYGLVAVGCAYATVFMLRRANLYYNKNIWYRLSILIQGALVIAATAAAITGVYWLVTPLAVLFIGTSLMAGQAANKIIVNDHLKKHCTTIDIT
tara:strand:+ start:187806 stop:188135 length:330 start_codon:yes stop_codon:yes gene_type:complete